MYYERFVLTSNLSSDLAADIVRVWEEKVKIVLSRFLFYPPPPSSKLITVAASGLTGCVFFSQAVALIPYMGAHLSA